jgi:hypothetical protein
MPYFFDLALHESGLLCGLALNVCALLFALRSPSRDYLYFEGPGFSSTTTTSGCIAQLQEALDWRASSLWWRTFAYWSLSLWAVSGLLVSGLFYYYVHLSGPGPSQRPSSGRSISSSAKPLRGSRRD